jgi:peptidoglycan/xylan/chitin deacetylase (PgdA/CDA1 family)
MIAAGKLHFGFFIDSEATQPAINDAALGARADRGIADVLESRGLVGTFHVLPTEAEANAALYRELKARGHEIGLHVHPAAQGYGEFFGIYGPDQQRTILKDAKDRAESALGFAVGSLCIGYVSTNDHSYAIFEELGFRHGMTSLPTRVLPECASVHAGAPLGIHYANRHNRLLPGDMDYVEIPVTVDPESRLWGGKHPQDLRVELVDAKNHYYTIKKAIQRQLSERSPLMYLLGFTHNVFDYSDPRDFRRQTLEGIIAHVKDLCSAQSLELVPSTIGQIAAAYRDVVPAGASITKLELDRSGYRNQSTKPT